MFSGVAELLRVLHEAGYILTINTSSFSRNCQPLLQNANIEKYFDFIGTAEVSKSKIEKFNLVAEKYSASKEEMLFVTDTVGDIREAAAAGIPTIAVTWGAHKAHHFKKEPQENLFGIAESVPELKKMIEDFYHE